MYAVAEMEGLLWLMEEAKKAGVKIDNKKLMDILVVTANTADEALEEIIHEAETKRMQRLQRV